VYRPTVRYSDVYKEHINSLFHSTTLDRNQILRLALHVAAHSDQFNQILSRYKRGDVPLSSPVWKLDSPGLWMDNTLEETEEGKDVNDNIKEENETTRVIELDSRIYEKGYRCESQIKGRERQIPTRTIRNQGGITIRL
jgi:hypothetical protein